MGKRERGGKRGRERGERKHYYVLYSTVQWRGANNDPVLYGTIAFFDVLCLYSYSSIDFFF
jgi:hypothetical protein